MRWGVRRIIAVYDRASHECVLFPLSMCASRHATMLSSRCVVRGDGFMVAAVGRGAGSQQGALRRSAPG
ncbi:TPA: hypothetical protein ACXKGF_005122 [Escherichia coli]